MTLATIIVMAICIKLGFWQYNKAQAKLARQQQLQTGLDTAPVGLPAAIEDAEAWRYKRVKFSGTYASQYQILLDNKVNDAVVGYHVLTPVRLQGENAQYVLVNRGWVAGNLNRELPEVATPEGEQDVEGAIFIPLAKFFTLESPAAKDGKLKDGQLKDGRWKEVWQHIDMQRYAESVPFEIKPYVVRLGMESTVGGFSRNWPEPASRVTVHLGYAYQWFGFALTLFVIYIVLNLKKVKKKAQK